MTKKKEYVNFVIEDRIAVVTIDRPPVNALNRQVEEEIEAVFEELGSKSEAGAVIITGGGEKTFIAGADIKELKNTKPQKHRIRIGDYRIVYLTEKNTVKVIEIFLRGRGYQ